MFINSESVNRNDKEVQDLIENFSKLSDWEQKFEKLIELGKNLPELDPKYKTEDLKIKGCQSQVWLKADLNNEVLQLQGDSDALIVRGLVAVVLKYYSGLSPSEILSDEAQFLKTMGLDSGLSPSRTNGLYAMIKQIKYYATAFNYLLLKKQ